jgi:hypothetical protein
MIVLDCTVVDTIGMQQGAFCLCWLMGRNIVEGKKNKYI